jgi:hypothetical protein
MNISSFSRTFPKRFSTRPRGVVSKKEMGACRTRFSKGPCSRMLAETEPRIEKMLDRPSERTGEGRKVEDGFGDGLGENESPTEGGSLEGKNAEAKANAGLWTGRGQRRIVVRPGNVKNVQSLLG